MIRIGGALCACFLSLSPGKTGNTDLFRETNGIGIVLIHETSRVLCLYLYDSPEEQASHSRIIEMPFLNKDGFVVAGFGEKWNELLPFAIDKGSGPLLLCMEVRDHWYRVRLSDGKDYWMRQEERGAKSYDRQEFKLLELVPWRVFMAEKGWVSRKDVPSNPIRKRPSLKADTVAYEYGDCLGVTEVKGWWVKVEPKNGEGCISDTLYDFLPKGLFFKKGWVQWRNDSMLLLYTSPYYR